MGRFAQADTIIPEQTQGTQAWDRYAYTNNNPLRYNDPTGHCPWCVAALVGGLVSAGINYGMQVAANVYSGQDLSTAATNVDLKSIGISFVGGAIAGATMGAINPVLANVLVSETLAAGISGAVAGVAGGQAESLAEASINQISDLASGEDFDSSEFSQDAHDAGFLNGSKMIGDAVIGGALSAAGQKILRPIVGPARRIQNPMFFDDIYYQSKGYVTGLTAGFVRAASDILQETITQVIDEIDAE